MGGVAHPGGCDPGCDPGVEAGCEWPGVEAGCAQLGVEAGCEYGEPLVPLVSHSRSVRLCCMSIARSSSIAVSRASYAANTRESGEMAADDEEIATDDEEMAGEDEALVEAAAGVHGAAGAAGAAFIACEAVDGLGSREMGGSRWAEAIGALGPTVRSAAMAALEFGLGLGPTVRSAAMAARDAGAESSVLTG